MEKENLNCNVRIFIDNEKQPIAELEAPVQFDLDTRKLTDGEHLLKIVSKAGNGQEGIEEIKFFVRNGPAIDVEGLKNNQIVDGAIPLMINAYNKDVNNFNIVGSETPKSIPTWMWIVLVLFLGWAMYYFVTYFNIPDFVRPK